MHRRYPNMNDPLFTGVCTALVTPFLNGRVNYPMLQQLLRRQTDAGIRAVVLCGTTGEAPTLTDEEKLTIFAEGKTFIKEKCLIIAGTGSNNTAHAVALSRAAQTAGADALLVVSPYYNKATEEGLITHYRTIAEAVTIPLIIYNVPSRTGVDIPVSVYRELAQIPNVAGVKEASTDIRKILKIRTQCPGHFQVWSGNDDMTVPIMALGGAGVISVTSNVTPLAMQAMTDAALAGDFNTAALLQRKLLELTDALFCEVNPIPVKTAMRILGFDCGKCRLPLTPPSPDCEEKLRKLLQ